MAIVMTGIDHSRADLDVRSVFSFTQKMKKDAYELWKECSDISGCVLISTCNRMELWLSTESEADVSPITMLCEFLHVREEDYAVFFVCLKEREAIRHLFRLAAGLESRIIGEDQIVTQVGEALAFSRSCYATDHTLEVLFRIAVTAAKRVKTETFFSNADRSVIHTALGRLADQGLDVAGKRCMVIGNGMMGKLAAQVFVEHGADVTVTVRQYHSGVVEVPAGCSRISYGDRLSLLPECDFVVSATSSPNYTLSVELLAPLSVDHTIHMIDLAVPRDIEPSAGELPWVKLYDVDSFKIDLMSDSMKENLACAGAIIEEEEQKFYEWYEGKDYVPRIQNLKKIAGTDVSVRMTPVFRHLDMGEDEKRELKSQVAGASERMMNRLLFGLRTRVPEPVFRQCLQAMEEILNSPQ